MPRDWCINERDLSGDPRAAKRSVTLLDLGSSTRSANVIASSEPIDAPFDDTRASMKGQGEILREEFDGFDHGAFEESASSAGRS